MPRRDDDDDDNEDIDGPHFCSCCSCCCCSCCCSYWGNVFALNVLDFFLGGLFAGIGAYSFMLISASFSVLIVDHHIAWFVYPVAALGLFRIVTSFLSTFSILCNKASDAEVNRIVYKAHKSNLLLCTTFFVLFLGVLELLFALGMYELKEWTLNHLYGHLELYGNLTASDVEYFHSYYDYLNYAVVFCGVVLPLLRYRLSWAYYEDYSRSTEERDEILLRKKLKRLRKQQAREEKRKAAEAYEQEVRGKTLFVCLFVYE
jgi:signal transduction histidine kinase